MARFSHVLSTLALVLGILMTLLTLSLSEGGVVVRGLLMGGASILNKALRLLARLR